jgi:hypothetical protein
MSIYQDLKELFGIKKIVCPDRTKILCLDIDNNLKSIIANIGLPKVFNTINFTMDFDSILKDKKINSFINNPDRIYTIGFEGITNQIGRNIFPSSIGLDDNVSLAVINSRLQDFRDDYSLSIDSFMTEIFEAEYNFAKRICINFEKNGEVISIDPRTLSSSFINSDIEKLVQTLIVIERNFNTYRPDFDSSMIELMLNTMMNDVKEVDPFALKDENCKWYQIMEAAIQDIEES